MQTYLVALSLLSSSIKWSGLPMRDVSIQWSQFLNLYKLYNVYCILFGNMQCRDKFIKISWRKTTLLLPPAWIMMLLRFRVGLSLYVIPKHALWDVEDLKDYCLLSKVSTLNKCKQTGWHLSPHRQAPGFPNGWMKKSIWHGCPLYDWEDHMCTINQVLEKLPFWELFKT